MTRREWTIGLPIVVALLLCLGAYLHGTGRADAIGRLSTLRVFAGANGQRVAAVIGGRLQVFNADGRRLARQDMRALGFGEDPNDMDWTVDDQGVTEAWFFDDALPRLVRCRWNESRLRLETCANAIAGPTLKVNAGSRAVHIAVDRPGARVFVTDARGGVVQVFDFDGKLLARSERGAVPLAFPNRIRYLGDNTLLVGDNDHGRIVWLAAEPSRPIRMLRSLYAEDHGGARFAHRKVTDAVTAPDGTLWMLALLPGQRDGDILVFDRAGRAVGRAELPSDADPLIVEALGDALLVGDFSAPRLYRVDAAGRRLDDFGDPAFRAELLALQREAQHAARWMWAAGCAALGVFVLGAVLAWRFSERPAPRGRVDAATLAQIDRQRTTSAALKFPLLIEASAEHRRHLRRAAWGSSLLVLVGVAAVTWLVVTMRGHVDHAKLSWTVWMQLLGAVAIPLAVVAVQVLAPRHSLQVSKDGVRWLKGDRTVADVPLHSIFASASALLIGSRLLMIRRRASFARPGPWVFDPTLLQQAILARLPAENLLDDAALQRKMLERNVPLKALVVAAIVGMLGITAWTLYRGLF